MSPGRLDVKVHDVYCCAGIHWGHRLSYYSTYVICRVFAEIGDDEWISNNSYGLDDQEVLCLIYEDGLPIRMMRPAHICSTWWRHQMEIFPRYWPFVRGIHRWHSPHKGQWRGVLMFSFICAWMNGWVNNREAGDLRRHRAHYDTRAMIHRSIYKHRIANI